MTVTVTGGTTSVVVSDDGGNVTVEGSTPAVTVSAPGGGSGPPLSNADPQPLGTAGPGESSSASRADHVHAAPTPGDIGAASTTDLSDVNTNLTDRLADLSGVTDPTAAKANLGLGTAAVKDTGTGSGNVILGNDSRLTDTRTPTDASVSLAKLDATQADRLTGLDLMTWQPVVINPPMFATTANSGTWTPTIATTSVSLWPYLSGPNTQNAYVEWASLFVLAAGTYTVTIHGNANTDKGIATVSVDGSSIGTADFYAGSGSAVTLTVTTSYAPSTTARHTLRITAATKNASSSGYALRPGLIVFQRTA